MKGLVGKGRWRQSLLHGRCWVEERWIMTGWEREDEESTIGAEKRGCQGGAWGGMMWSKPLASTTTFSAAL